LSTYGGTTVYLKTKGINPENHPVVTELGRIKSYYGKIQNAENPEKR
jgi:exosome complex protein LRP1